MSDLANCPVCLGRHIPTPLAHGRCHRVSCVRCGEFLIDDRAAELNTPDRLTGRDAPDYPAWRAALSHRLRTGLGLPRHADLTEDGLDLPFLDAEAFERAQSGAWRLPAPPQRADLLVREIGDRQEDLGGPVPKLTAEIEARIGARDADDLSHLFRELRDLGLLTGVDAAIPGRALIQDVCLTLAGWRRWETLQARETRSRIGFIALKFNEPDLDDFLDCVVKPAVAAMDEGFSVERVDERKQDGLIDHLIRQRLREAPFVLVDITHGNLGAYWEAGFAEALGKPTIYLKQKSKGQAHFDVRNATILPWEWDPDWTDARKSAEKAAFGEELRATIRYSFAARKARG